MVSLNHQSVEASSALDGVRVVEIGQFVAGPGASMLLADLGADVVKVEPHDGDQGRRTGRGEAADSVFMAFNRGKRSISLHLRSDEGRQIVTDLARSADILIQNLSPGLLAGMGLGASDLRAQNPRLIYASVVGFPSTSPSARRKGYDSAAQAESGMMYITGEATGPPQRVGFPVIDSVANFAVVTAVLAALLRRAQTGEGDIIEVSLLDVGVQLQALVWSEYSLTGVEPTRHGSINPHAAPAGAVLPATDGSIIVSAYTNEHFAALCNAIGQPDLPADPRFVNNDARVQHRLELMEALESSSVRLSMDELCQRLEDAGVVAGAVRSPSQVLHAADTADAFIAHTDGNQRSAIGVVPPYRFASATTRPSGLVPRLGQHTESVLAELGLDGVQVSDLVERGIVLSQATDRPS